MVHYVSFPGLFDKVFKLNQVAFHIGNWPIRWYGVILAVAFLLGALYLMKRASKFETDPDTVIDLLIIALPCGVLGARAYYVFNSWDYYKDHLNELLSIWNGGLAIYGGVIAGILVVLLFGRKNRHRFNILSFLDVGALGLLIGQIIGRWGNFVNGEAFGTATNLPWGMVISQTATGGGVEVHPTFLYESLWNLLGFTVLHFYSKRPEIPGRDLRLVLCLVRLWPGPDRRIAHRQPVYRRYQHPHFPGGGFCRLRRRRHLPDLDVLHQSVETHPSL